MEKELDLNTIMKNWKQKMMTILQAMIQFAGCRNKEKFMRKLLIVNVAVFIYALISVSMIVETVINYRLYSLM